jgi:hypothetical protein
MKAWLVLLILAVAVVSISTLSAENDSKTTFVPIVFGPYPAIVNGDFELGALGWRGPWRRPTPVYHSRELGGVEPFSGAWAARINGDLSDLYQEGIVVPRDRPYLTYWRRVSRVVGECDPARHISRLGIVVLDETLLFARDVITMCTDTDWEQHIIDLSPIAGRPIRIGFSFGPGDSGAFWPQGSALFLDDFRFAPQP